MDLSRASLKFLLFALWSLLIVPIQILIMLLHKGHFAYILPKLWHKGVCAIFGIRYVVQGAPIKNDQTLFVSNHISYLDIPLLGGLIPSISFVAKKDVESWPVFGFLSKLQQTYFISRRAGDAAKETGALSTLLAQGKNLLVFPEGTSTDGRDVRPFKSSLFSIVTQAQSDALMIQPLTLSIQSVDGRRAPDTQDLRDLYAWHIDMDTPLPTHLWRFAKSRGAVIALTFHEAFPAHTYEDRKTLAKTCHDTVCKGLDIQKAA